MSNYILIDNKLINLDSIELISIKGEWIHFKGGEVRYEFHIGSEINTLWDSLKYKLIPDYSR